MMSFKVVRLMVCVCCCCLLTDALACTTNITEIFVTKLIETEAANGNLTANNFASLLSKFEVYQSNNGSHCSQVSGLQDIADCVSSQCLSYKDLLQLHSVPVNKSHYTAQDVQTLSPALLYQSQREKCQNKTEHKPKGKKKPSSFETWGFGFLFVTIINLCSLVGAFVLPFMKKKIYQQILIFMVALAVGSLAGSGLLFLIPEALGLVGEGDDMNYIWKGTTVFGGIYLFFIIERLLQFFLQWRKRHDDDRDISESLMYQRKDNDSDSDVIMPDSSVSSFRRKTPLTSSQKYRESIGTEEKFEEDTSSTTNDISATDNELKSKNGHATDMVIHQPKHQKPIKTVAWMIIFGDGFHNFIDGLSIGAAFTDSILAGISISLAVICEELPHELGDFAILLNAGLTVKKALLFNFMSACMCYFGLIIGTVVGENTSANEWIFGIAGGMFLYISLVDMMPEMNSAAESEEKIRTIGSIRIFILQNLGMLCGFAALLLMAVFGGEISFEQQH